MAPVVAATAVVQAPVVEAPAVVKPEAAVAEPAAVVPEPAAVVPEPAEATEPEVAASEPAEAAEPEVAASEPAEAAEPEVAASEPAEAAEPEVAASEPTETAEPEVAASEPEVAASEPASPEPVAAAPSTVSVELPLAALQGEVSPRLASPSRPSFPPPLPSSPSLLPLLPSAVSFPPAAPLGSESLLVRLAAVRKRVTSSIPPRWIEVARTYPVLWMVVAPVVVALLLIVVMLALQPPPRPAAALAMPAPSAALASPHGEQPSVTPAAVDQAKASAVAALEGKAPDSLSVEELLLVNESRAQHKREDAKAVARKLQEQPELAKDQAVQAQLLHFAADPDTAADALGAMAEVHTPVGPDLLYEVWTNHALSSTTTELARALLYSRDVRPSASPALAVALGLRGAASCEAVQEVLPKASGEGDRRSLFLLAKLNARRGCGPKKTDDCYACLRSQNKQIVAATDAVKRRSPPSYPAH